MFYDQNDIHNFFIIEHIFSWNKFRIILITVIVDVTALIWYKCDVFFTAIYREEMVGGGWQSVVIIDKNYDFSIYKHHSLPLFTTTTHSKYVTESKLQKPSLLLT